MHPTYPNNIPLRPHPRRTAHPPTRRLQKQKARARRRDHPPKPPPRSSSPPPIHWPTLTHAWSTRMRLSRRWVHAQLRSHHLSAGVARELFAYFGRDRYGPRRAAECLSGEAMAGLRMMQEGGGLGRDLDWVREMVGKGVWGGWGGRVERLFKEFSLGEGVKVGKWGGGVNGNEGDGEEGGMATGGTDGMSDGNGEAEGKVDGRGEEAMWTVGESDLEDGEWDLKSEYGEEAVDESW